MNSNNFIDYISKINARMNILTTSNNKSDLPVCNYATEYIVNNRKLLTRFILLNNKEKLTEFVHKTVDYATKRIIETIIDLNQYIYINTFLRKKIAFVYEDYVTKIIKLLYFKVFNIDNLSQIITEHYVKLSNILASINEVKLIKRSKNIPCFEYSAKFQIELLNIDLNNIKEPILDLGCGSKAYLVKYLSTLGLDVYGVDRLIESKSNTIQADWFNYKLKSNNYGAIISHLSFTNHFKRNHYKKDGNHIAYARKYKDLLNSLKPGGEFYYTPDLPFIEQFLSPDLFTVTKKAINHPKMSIQAVKITKGSWRH